MLPTEIICRRAYYWRGLVTLAWCLRVDPSMGRQSCCWDLLVWSTILIISPSTPAIRPSTSLRPSGPGSVPVKRGLLARLRIRRPALNGKQQPRRFNGKCMVIRLTYHCQQ
eukprot:scaffold33792_cov33-Prasinocladus_malaysianus.AAC.2